MARLVQRPANLGDVGGHSSRSLVVKDKDGLNLPVLVSAQMFFHQIGRDTGSVGNFEKLHLDPVGACRFAETAAEVAIDAAQHPITRGEGVHYAGLPGSGARAGIEEDLTSRCLKHALKPFQDFLKQAGKFRSAMVDEGLRHRSDDPLWDQRGAGDLEKRTARHQFTPLQLTRVQRPRLRTIDLTSMYSSIPCFPPSRPSPLSLKPPKGIS